MDKNLIFKHIIDCLLIFLISFGSAAIALQEITLKAIIIASIASLIPALIKFRTIWETKVMPTTILF